MPRLKYFAVSVRAHTNHHIFKHTNATKAHMDRQACTYPR